MILCSRERFVKYTNMSYMHCIYWVMLFYVKFDSVSFQTFWFYLRYINTELKLFLPHKHLKHQVSVPLRSMYGKSTCTHYLGTWWETYSDQVLSDCCFLYPKTWK